MRKKRINTNIHYAQYVIARIVFIFGVGFLVYSIWIQKTSAIVFCSFFLIYTLVLQKKVFNKPIAIAYDENYIYVENGKEGIELNKVIRINRNQILYESNGIESIIKLPNFHFMDKNWKELKKLIDTKSIN